MKRINKTRNNLQLVYDYLDDACGFLENARYNIADMVDMPERVVELSEQIDISHIVALKQEIEKMIEEKK